MNFLQKTGATFAGGLGLLASALGIYEMGRSDFRGRLESESKSQFERGLQEGREQQDAKSKALHNDLEKRLRSEAANEASKSFETERSRLTMDAEARGFERGVTQTRLQYQDNENQAKILAGIMTIVQSPTVKQALTPVTNEKIATISRNIDSGDLKSAVDALPNGVDIAVKDNCLDLRSGDFVFVQGQTFDVCETKEFVAVKSANFNGYMNLVVDGEDLRVPINKKTQFNDNCTIHFLKADKNAHDAKSTVRFNCSAT
ncbi:MAG: hypothetical protein ACOH2J_13190 [Allorhizobium sp.]